MERIWVPISSTHIDRHGDRLALSALEGIAAQVKRQYIPVGIEHDPRFPPMGRVVSARLVSASDGETVLEVEQELWADGDSPSTTIGDGREIPIEDRGPGLYINYDRSMSDATSKRLLLDLQALTTEPPQETFKKAFDPLVILEFIFVGGLALGFLNRAGGDVYDGLKARLVEHYRSRPGSPQLDLVIMTECADRPVELVVIYERPGSDGVAELFSNAGPAIDAIALESCRSEPNLGRVVIGWDGKHARHLYSVRRDAVPIDVREVPDLPAGLAPDSKASGKAVKRNSHKAKKGGHAKKRN